jgi:hypothetical protein
MHGFSSLAVASCCRMSPGSQELFKIYLYPRAVSASQSDLHAFANVAAAGETFRKYFNECIGSL